MTRRLSREEFEKRMRSGVVARSLLAEHIDSLRIECGLSRDDAEEAARLMLHGDMAEIAALTDRLYPPDDWKGEALITNGKRIKFAGSLRDKMKRGQALAAAKKKRRGIYG